MLWSVRAETRLRGFRDSAKAVRGETAGSGRNHICQRQRRVVFGPDFRVADTHILMVLVQ